MLFTSAEISAIVGSYIWPMIRIAALIMALPVFSSTFVPMRARVILVVGLTLVIAPVIPPVPEIEVISVAGFFLILQQILIGILMGFIFHLVFAAFIVGSQIIAMQMGLGFSMMVDPLNGAQTPVLSMMFVLMITLFFLILDGHLALIGVLADSFTSLPISNVGYGKDVYWEFVHFGTDMFKGAVMVALPAITALLLVNMSLGVMGRAAPQLNIFAVGFSITITAGFFVMIWTLPVILTQFENLALDAMSVVKDIVNQE